MLGVFDDAGLNGLLSHDLMRCRASFTNAVEVEIDLPPDLSSFDFPLADDSAIVAEDSSGILSAYMFQ